MKRQLRGSNIRNLNIQILHFAIRDRGPWSGSSVCHLDRAGGRHQRQRLWGGGRYTEAELNTADSSARDII